MADQLSGMREPDLILTSPTTATAKDDGYLLGSGNAALKLDAEWVSCNFSYLALKPISHGCRGLFGTGRRTWQPTSCW